MRRVVLAGLNKRVKKSRALTWENSEEHLISYELDKLAGDFLFIGVGLTLQFRK